MTDSAYSQDVLTRIYNVHWGGVDQQGLLAEYPPLEGTAGVMDGMPTAYALDSGEVFEGVNAGASGLGYTVLTRGFVCFGKPRDGEACFIASPDASPSQRGILDEDGVLVWSNVAIGGGAGFQTALTFAGDAFFAVFQEIEGPARIATSFDGINWATAQAFSGKDAYGGAVAAVQTAAPTPEEPAKYLYVACGEIEQKDDDYGNVVQNLMWSTSTDGNTWSSGYNPGMMTEPGTWYNLLLNFACTVAAGTVNKEDGVSNDVLVAAAATKTQFVNHLTGDLYAMRRSGGAMSTTGTSWNVTGVGINPGLDQLSWGLAVTYCQSKDSDGGYFLMSDHEIFSDRLGDSNLYRSADGVSWSKVRTNKNWMARLSAIASDLSDATKIVRI